MITDQIVSIAILCFVAIMAAQDTPQTKARARYHHGDLRRVLIDEGATLLAQKGAEGFSMREVARRAGVAVAAPAHHFSNAKGLLTAIATCGFDALAKELTQAGADQDDPVDRVVALCRRYVEMGQSHPGYAAVMFRWDLVDQSDIPYLTSATSAMAALSEAVAAASPAATSDSDVDHAARTLWAVMHGFVALSLVEDDTAADRIRFAVETLLRGVRNNPE